MWHNLIAKDKKGMVTIMGSGITAEIEIVCQISIVLAG